MKHILLAACISFLVIVPGTLNSAPATLHMVMVIDTEDKGIGCKYDMKNWNNLLGDIKKYTGMKMNVTYLKDKNWRKRDVLKALAKIKPAPSDVVIFYYSGHGYRFQKGQKDPWPWLALKDSSLSLHYISQMLKRKNNRLFLAISDSCNSYCPGSPPMVRSRAYASKAVIQKNYRELFLKAKGTIVASGCIAGQYSFGGKPDGGAYTSTLLKNLRLAVTSKKASWKQIFQASNKPLIGGKQQPQYTMKVDASNMAIHSDINHQEDFEAGGDIDMNDLKDPAWCRQALDTMNIFNDAVLVLGSKGYLPANTKEYKRLYDFCKMQHGFMVDDKMGKRNIDYWKSTMVLVRNSSKKKTIHRYKQKLKNFLKTRQVSWNEIINDQACVKKKKK